jgi:glycosyltransferase involved in cell wall biosynthesis
MTVGGPAVLLSELIKNLPPEEFEHVLITGTCLPNEIDYLDSHPLDSEVIYIDDIQRTVLPIKDLKSFFTLVKVLRRLQPDIVHTHTSKAGVLGRLAAKLVNPRIRIIHTFHGHVLYGYFSHSITKFIILIERLLGLITDDAVAITTPVMSDLRQVRIARKAKWHVIHPAVLDQKQVKKLVDLDSIRLGWVGRFSKVKNPMLALEAFRILSLNYSSKVELVMIGDGSLKTECEKYSRKHNLNVSFLGWRNDVHSQMSRFDLLLLTSLNEGLGLVALEAGLASIPTLSTPVGGVTDLIINNETGFLSKQDPIFFAYRIDEIISNNSLRKTVGANVRKAILKGFSMENYIEKHIDLYKS